MRQSLVKKKEDEKKSIPISPQILKKEPTKDRFKVNISSMNQRALIEKEWLH